ncbi:hypothetical protein ACFV19_14720 [Streptomyces griseoluteus]|uniref:hypothetical protein n=1 Tax=Streptomyces griseoluteus TaxID=29306 RepID=UPI0036BE7D7C
MHTWQINAFTVQDPSGFLSSTLIEEFSGSAEEAKERLHAHARNFKGDASKVKRRRIFSDGDRALRVAIDDKWRKFETVLQLSELIFDSATEEEAG